MFDKYRIFYEQESDIKAAENFLTERLKQNESIIFVARDDDAFVGFTQLYPSFTSVGMKAIWVLNDLYVEAEYRKKGIGAALINAAMDYCKLTKRKRVILSTDITNTPAQKLYEHLGFERGASYNYEKEVNWRDER